MEIRIQIERVTKLRLSFFIPTQSGQAHGRKPTRNYMERISFNCLLKSGQGLGSPAERIQPFGEFCLHKVKPARLRSRE